MEREIASYLLMDRLFFESIGLLPISSTYKDIVESLLPQGCWKVVRDETWLKAFPATSEKPPLQGFKIHVSATLVNAEEVLRRLVSECVTENVPFKLAADPQVLGIMTSKNYGRGGASKFFVLYPRDTELFKVLLARLHAKTRDLEGAYILSDRRYEDSKILYYRYGGFASRWQLTPEGRRMPLVEAPDGRMVPDERLPYFRLPDWVDDPFGGIKDLKSGDGGGDELLNGRYEVRSSLSFSNSGGVYLALDRETGKMVVLKEARPRTNVWLREDGGFFDAVDVLRNEHEILRRLADLPFVVNVVDLFEEWEHTFLVEEQAPGIPLANYRARDEFHLLPLTRDSDRLRRFCERFRVIAQRLTEYLGAIHEAGVVLGDLSPSNILIQPETLDLCFIDMESSVTCEGGGDFERFSSRWSTPGYRKGRRDNGRPQAEDDYYALGMTLFSLILPVTTLFDLDPTAEERILEKLRDCVDLPEEVIDSINALRNGNPEEAQRILRQWDIEAAIALKSRWPERSWRVDAEEVRRSVRRLADFVVSTTNPGRRDRLWPGDIRVFQTNSMNVANGACGVALFLKRTLGNLSSEAEEWMLAQPLSPQSHPPGLYPGLAGIAYTFAQLGHAERGAQILDASRTSPLVFTEANWFEGAAGWAWVNLYFHRLLSEPRFLDRAVEAGERLLSTVEDLDGGSSWRRQADGRVHFGMAYGAAGVAFFLLHLYEATQETRYLKAARSALRFEIAHARQQFGGLGWVRWEQDTLVMPYWMHGSAGLVAVLSRFYLQLKDEEDLQAARRAADGAFARFAVQTDQFSGLSGLGEAMLDMYLATKDELFLEKAYDIADSLLRFRIERPEGLAFPGRLLLRISNDFGTGGAGVGLFLERLINPGPRLFHDLDANCKHRALAGTPTAAAKIPAS